MLYEVITHPPVREYFDRAFLGAYLDRAFEDMRARNLLVGGGGSYAGAGF